MGHQEQASFKTPTRIPRPVSMVSSPRSPSIRAVPYNHADRPVHASWAPGNYSPSSWPFPKSTKSSSMSGTSHPSSTPKAAFCLQTSKPRDLGAATTRRPDAHNPHMETMNNDPDSRSGNENVATGDRTSSHAGNHDQTTRDRSSDGHESIITQIYAPHQSSATVAVGMRSRSNSTKGSFLGVQTEVPERPMTPTPYSPLQQKALQASMLESEEGGSAKPQSGERLGSARRSLFPSLHRQQDPEVQDYTTSSSSVAATTSSSNPARSLPSASPGEGGNSPALAGALSFFRSSITSSKSQKARNTGDKDEDDQHPGPSASDAAAAARNNPPGIAIFEPNGNSATGPAVGAKQLRKVSILSMGQTTVREETAPDLASIRRGPRLRHSRLPPSPSMPAGHGWQLPRSAREIWGIVDRLWYMMLVSAAFLELSILNFVSSITAVIMVHTEHRTPAVGLVAWAAVSSTFVVTFGMLLGFSILQYRKTSKNLVSGENWIEMHRRSRPLPPRPGSEEREQDNAATEAWQKFAQDHKQLRRYVEFLENRVGVLEEAQSAKIHQQSEERNTGATQPAGGARDLEAGNDNDDGDSTPKAKKTYVGGSLSRRKLLQRDDTGADSDMWREGEGNAPMSKSDTKASILTELCEAVTEGYSPLCEQMPRVTAHPSPTSNNGTPSGRPRGSTVHHLGVRDRSSVREHGAHQ